MNPIRITADRRGPVQLELVGDFPQDLIAPNRPGSVRGFRRFWLWVKEEAEAEGLRFDVSARFDELPGGGTSTGWNHLPSMHYGNLEKDGDRFILPQGQKLTFQVHLPSPLTPYGQGLWMRLIVQANNNQLVVLVSHDTSSLWYRARKEIPPKELWASAPFPRVGTSPTLTMREWLDGWKVDSEDQAGMGYTAAHGLKPYDDWRGDLLTPGPRDKRPRWLVEVPQTLTAFRGFRCGFLPAPAVVEDSATGRRAYYPLVTGLWLDAEAAGQARVSARSLGLEDVSGRAAALRATTVRLLCARQFKEGTGEPADPWLLEWLGVDGRSEQSDTIACNTVYGLLARHYPLGLAAARSRNRVTVVPTALWTDDPIRLRFIRTEAGVHLLAVLLGESNPANIQLGGMVNWDGSIPLLECRAGDNSEKVKPIGEALSDRQGGPVLAATFQPREEPSESPTPMMFQPREEPSESPTPMIAGVRVRCGSLRDFNLTLTRETGMDRFGQAPIGVKLNAGFNNAVLTPVSQDPEVGFETQSAWLRRERPMVIDLTDTTVRATLGLALSLTEQATSSQSRRLRLELRAPAGRIRIDTSVVVLDPSPFLVARVDARAEVAQGEVVAEYTDDADQAAEWAFRSDQGGMDLVLPPQAIGEEMIKGRLYLRPPGSPPTEVPAPGKPFDFRWGMPAYLKLDRTDVDTMRATAPWAIRRLLSIRRGTVGLKLAEARFELLYGLMTTIKASGLRVAELDAFVGRMPFSDELVKHFLAAQDSDTEAAEEDRRKYSKYSKFIGFWIADLLYRPTWWPLFRGWAERESLTVSDQVRFDLRGKRQTANPFEPHAYAVPQPPKPEAPPPLRGGVDWPFQSRSVYDEFLRSEPGVGSVTGVAFGSLGGSGSQTAAFNNGKTLIISDTSQGRLNSLTLIRLGRIAMLWNHARHVIVYERTSRRAPRYARPDEPPDQTDSLDWQSGAFDGFGALRKVREYVEITLPRRRYPDYPTDFPLGGPLVQSTFETLTIPVKAGWGRDIPKGWVMPLRGPIEPGEEDHFPFPKIFLELARAGGKGGGSVAHQVADPAQLLFFTSTRPEDGGNTDLWPAWPDVDFPLIRQAAAPNLPYRSSFSGTRKQPDATAFDFGQGRFTLDLIPAEEAVNLLHGREGTGLEASVRAVTLARGELAGSGPARPLAGRLAPRFAGVEARLHDGFAEVQERLASLARQRSPGTQLTELGPLRRDLLGVLTALLDAAGEAGTALDDAENQLSGSRFSWPGENERWRARARTRLGEFAEVVASQLAVPAPGDAKALTGLRHNLEAVAVQARQALDGIGFLPAAALERLRAAERELPQRLNQRVTAVLTDLRAWVATARSRTQEAGSESAGPLVDDLARRLRLAAERVRSLGHDAEPWIARCLGEWFSPAASGEVKPSFARLLEPAQVWVTAQAAGLADLADELPPTGLEDVSFEQLDHALALQTEQLGSELQEAFEEVATWVKDLTDTLGQTGWRARLEEWYGSFSDEIAGALKVLDPYQPEELREQLEKVKTRTRGWGQELYEHLGQCFKTLQKSDSTWKALEGSFEEAAQFKDATGKILKELRDKIVNGTTSIEELAARFEQQGAVWFRHLRATGAEIEQAVRTEFAQAGANVADQARDVGLELTRAMASGPVNDALACTRDALGYYYDRATSVLGVTRASAVFNDLGQAALNALSAEIPFDRIRDRLLPQLGGLDLNRLLPDFGGLKLEHLLPDLTIPKDPLAEYGWLSVKHGFDKDRLTAWSDVRIDRQFEEDPGLFRLPPVELRLLRPRFTARSRMELSADGAKAQKTEAMLAADWQMQVSHRPLVTLREATLRYDNQGGFDFRFDSEKVELAAEFQFITQALRALLPQVEGLTLTPLAPGGMRAELCLPLPDLGAGAFTLTGVTLYSHLDLLIAGGFEVRTGFWLSRPERPFGLAILFLGGGGWFGVEARYRPPTDFDTRVSIGISAGAFLALNLGVARGSAGLLFTAGLEWSSGKGSTAISLGLLVWGEFSILGVASAGLRMMLTITYQNGAMTGHGMVDVSIKICWCFTLTVRRPFTLPFARPGGSGGGAQRVRSTAGNAGAPPADGYGDEPEPEHLEKAVELYFQNLLLN